MKKFLSILIAAAMMISSFSATVSAVQGDSVTAVLSTDKDEYAQGEKINAQVTVTNETEGILTNVKLIPQIPDGYVIDEDSEYVSEIDRIAKSESANMRFTLVQQNQGGTVTNPDNNKNLYNTFKAFFEYIWRIIRYIFTGKKTNELSSDYVLTLSDSMQSNDNTKAEKTIKVNGDELTIMAEVAYVFNEEKPETGKNVLIAYFSATGNTRGIAQHIASVTDAHLYEIIPEIPYTSADLNYNNSSSRANIEMNDPNARPAISGSVENMEDYDIIFLGYPIWWGQAPRIINTFLESYDFSGKTIIPFCTSGSSGIGSSATNLHSMAPDATWLSGRRFASSASQSTVAAWIDELDLDLN